MKDQSRSINDDILSLPLIKTLTSNFPLEKIFTYFINISMIKFKFPLVVGNS